MDEQLNFKTQDLETLKELAELYRTTKALVLYAEEVDPDSSSNLQIIKELRDAFDHLMRVISVRVLIANVEDSETYCSKNLDKARGHIYRAAFDALDGAALSLKIKISEACQGYSARVLATVVPEYYNQKKQVEEIVAKLSEYRASKRRWCRFGPDNDWLY